MNTEPLPNLLHLPLADGKYIIIQRHHGGVDGLRHGEPWRDLTGDNLVLCMAYEIEALRRQNAKLTEALEDFMESHEDCEQTGWNTPCSTDPCAWCQQAKEALQ